MFFILTIGHLQKIPQNSVNDIVLGASENLFMVSGIKIAYMFLNLFQNGERGGHFSAIV